MKKTLLSIFGITALLIFSTANANGQTDIFTDTFDAAPTNGATRVFNPDNSANGGTFPNSSNDVFGIVDRNVNFSFGDDSLSIFPADTFGIIPEAKTDFFLGFQDTVNGDNAGGSVSLTWTASTAGMTGLTLSFEIAAMGDFEAADLLEITASFDGGAAETLFSSAANVDITSTYTLEGGATVDLDDPFAIDGQIIINEFQTLSFPITGTGSSLTLTLNYTGDGGSEVVAIDNLSVTAGGGGVDPVLKGDVNLDGMVTFLDINPFILVLSSNGDQAEADCNCDGEVNFLDIQAFIDILSGA